MRANKGKEMSLWHRVACTCNLGRELTGRPSSLTSTPTATGELSHLGGAYMQPGSALGWRQLISKIFDQPTNLGYLAPHGLLRLHSTLEELVMLSQQISAVGDCFLY